MLQCLPGFSRKGFITCGTPQAGLPGAGGWCMRDGIQHFSWKPEMLWKQPTEKCPFHKGMLGDLIWLQVRTCANLESCHVLTLSPWLSGASDTRPGAEKGQSCLLCLLGPEVERQKGGRAALHSSSLPGRVAGFLLMICSVCHHEKLFAALLTLPYIFQQNKHSSTFL